MSNWAGAPWAQLVVGPIALEAFDARATFDDSAATFHWTLDPDGHNVSAEAVVHARSGQENWYVGGTVDTADGGIAASARATLDGWHLIDAAFDFDNMIDDDESAFDLRVLVPHLVLYDII